jgi:Cu(I)/Ag(I) efflux system membrane fusion protein
MNLQPRRSGKGLMLAVGLLLGLALGIGAAYAHFGGLLDPLYENLGWSASAGEARRAAPGDGAPTGHEGHGSLSTQTTGGQPSALPGHSVVTISPDRQQLIGVRTGKVKRDRLRMSIQAVGIIEPDQQLLRRIHTRISGWVTKVYVNFIGQEVRKDQRLLEIYSPDLMATQEEYVRALKGTGGSDDPSQGREAAAARRRLERWGVHQKELDELKRTRQVRETLLLRAPLKGRVLERKVVEGSYVDPAMELYQIADLSAVWVQAKIYEYELPHIDLKQKQPVHVSVLSQPGKTFEGKVSFVEPVLQEMTRTVKVRVALDNKKGLFKPGMYADVTIDHDMGTGLLVPETALLRTGKRAIAFRYLPGGRFEPVEVEPGAQFGERTEITKGLSEGDTVVTSAVFLIDAESRLKSAVSMPGGHQHGSGGGKPDAPQGHQHDGGNGKKPPKENGGGHEHHH